MPRSKCATTGKIRYVDYEAAQAAQERLQHNVNPYPCPECGGWHLGGHHRKRQGDALAQFGRTARTTPEVMVNSWVSPPTK